MTQAIVIEGLRVGLARFAPLPSEAGTIVPVAFGSRKWKTPNETGATFILKATFSLDASPMKVVAADPIVVTDLVPRKAAVDVVMSDSARAHTNEARLVVSQRNTSVLDITRKTTPGGSTGMEAAEASGTTQLARPDQRVEEIDPDAVFLISGVFQARPSIVVRLPSARAAGVVFGANPQEPSEATVLPFKLDTVSIHPSRMQMSIVWRAVILLRSDVEESSLIVGAGIATYEFPFRLRRKLEDLQIEARGEAAASARKEKRKVKPGQLETSLHMPAIAGGGDDDDPPVSLPFKKGAAPSPPPATGAQSGKRKSSSRTRAVGGTLPMTGDKAVRTLPFFTEEDRAAAKRQTEEAELELKGLNEKAQLERERTARALDQKRVADEQRTAAQQQFEEEQRRLRKLEAERKDLAAKLAKEQAQKLDEGLYGSFGKKKPPHT